MKQLVILAMFALVGCGTVNNALTEKTKKIEYYRIFDIKTQADRYVIAESASNGLGRNAHDAQETIPIPTSDELPDKAGRFKLVNPFEGSKLAALAATGGSSGMKIATCEGASWTAKASRTISGQSHLKLTACLFPYAKGYHLNFYANFSKKEGGLLEVSRKMASAMVGTPEEWTEKTFLDTVRQIRKDTGADITFLEGYPAIQGTPWLDSGEAL
jgi:hypothetical protein